jgi:hypothetical protein
VSIMPPKTKSKAPPPSAQFPFTQRAAPPAPAPLAPHRRLDAPQSLLVVRDPQGNVHSIALYVSDGRLHAHDVTMDTPIVLKCPTLDLASTTVTQVAAQDGGTIAMVCTEPHGILIVGKLPDEPVVAQFKDELLAVRHASALNGSLIGVGHKAICVATSSRHSLAVVVDSESGGSTVRGYGFTDMNALGTAPPSRTTIHATDGLGRVPRPKQNMHDGALPTTFLLFAALRELGGYSPTAVFAARHMSFFVCNQGILACGYLSPSCSFAKPRIVFDHPHVQIHQVVSTNRAVYALTSGNRILRMTAPSLRDQDDQDPETTVDEEGLPIFVDVTARLGFCCDALVGDDEGDDGAVSPSILKPHAQLSRLVSGADHCVVVDRVHGVVYGWGSNAFGQLGQPSYRMLEAHRAVQIPIPVSSSNKDEVNRHATGSEVPEAQPTDEAHQCSSSIRSFASVHAFGMTTLLLDASMQVLARYGQ